MIREGLKGSTVLCALFGLSQAFYIPGFSYKSYRDGDNIPLYVNKIHSDHSELQYKYIDLPFVCPPTGRVRDGQFTSGASLSLNLGEVLRGDRITASDYELIMGNDEEVRHLCSHTVDKAGLKQTRELIRDGYLAEWIVDNLPGSTSFQTTDKTRKYYAAGFKIGEEVISAQNGMHTYFLNNHVTIVIRYNRALGRDGRHGKKVIVGFEVFPKSIHAANRTASGLPQDISDVPYGLDLVPRSSSTGDIDESADATLTIPFTYSVYFREDKKLEWKNRWDMYFVAQDDSSSVHWLAIANSLVIAGCLTVSVAVIFARTINGEIKAGLDKESVRFRSARKPRKPFEKGSLLEEMEDAEADADISSDEETLENTTGWKLLHGDVFRAPFHGELLASIIGSGTQLTFMAIGILILGCLGVLNPSFRGGYISVGLGLFVLAGLFSGYFSGRIYKTFGGENWQKNAFVTASLVPGLLFSIIFFVNLFVWIQASSNAIPFGTLVALVALWLFIQLPLVYMGGHYGFNTVGSYIHPLKANLIARQVPVQSWYTAKIQTILFAGFIPFAVVFIELIFVFKSLWQDKSGFYYLFGFFAVVSTILVITVVEVTITATYLQLCSENYHWWWQSFLVGGSSSIWIFLYIVWYYFVKLHITGFVSSLLFFCYGFLACTVYGLLTGTIGFLAAYGFVRRLYSAVKVD